MFHLGFSRGQLLVTTQGLWLLRASRADCACGAESGFIAGRRVGRPVEVRMPEHSTRVRDVAALRGARVGRVEKSDDSLRPFRLLDADGTEVAAVSEFLHHMLADDASVLRL